MKRQFKELMRLSFTFIILLIGCAEAQSQYCIPGSSDVAAEWIAGVEFAGIDNPTPTAPASSYTDFTDITGIVAPGGTYAFIGTIGNAATWTETMAVWIDFNQDEVFDEATERFNLPGSCSSNGCELTTDIIIPLDAIPGVTRMRVRQNFNAQVADACATAAFSETEDYSLLVGGDCTPPDFAYTITDDCDAFTYNVTATLNDFGSDIDGPNQSITIYLNRSDIGDAGFVTYGDDQVGQTADVITDVPFGVVVTASIEGNDSNCSLSRTWSAEGLCPPVNNECNTATEVFCGVSVDGSTANASPFPEGLDICTAFNSPSGAVWYEYTAPFNSIVSADISADFDAQHAVFTGECGNLTCLGSSDFSAINFNANAGETFYVMVFGWGTSSGDFYLILNCTELTCAFPGLTAMAVDSEGLEITDEDCIDFSDTYRISVTLAGGEGNDSFTVTVGDSVKTMVADETHIFGVYSAGGATDVTVVGDDEAICEASASVSVAVCPPINNECETAIELECWETIEGSTMNGSGAPAGIEFCNGLTSPSAPAVWYKYTADSYSSLTVSITPDNFDAQHFVYAGGCGDLQCINGSDEEPISWLASAGQTFYIMVTGWGTSAGNFALNLECLDFPACDYPTLNTTMVDENGGEITDCLPVGDAYRVEVSLGTGGPDDAYLVVVGDSSKVMFPPETHVFGTFDAGSNTNVIVSSFELPEYCNLYGLIESEVCPPENDLACNAIPLDCGAYVVGSNVSATENISCNGSSRQTAWYSYTATSNEPVFITTCNPETNFDTDINIYTGTCDGDLVCFPGWGDGGYIDGNSACEFQSWAAEGTFDVEAGVTYYIAVTGYYQVGSDDPWEGSFGLSLSRPLPNTSFIEGTVDWIESCGDRDIIVGLYIPDTEDLFGSYSGVVDQYGDFTVSALPIGTFDIIVKIDGSLAKGFTDFAISSDANTLDIGAVIKGDINGDNKINIIDVSVITSAFNSSEGDANFNPLADLNCSGGVNIADISIVTTSFFAMGAEAPLE